MTNNFVLLSQKKYAQTVLATFQEFLPGPNSWTKAVGYNGTDHARRKSHHGKPIVQTVAGVVDVPDGLNQTRPGTCHLTAVLFLVKPWYGTLAGGTENPGVCAEYAGCRFAVP